MDLTKRGASILRDWHKALPLAALRGRPLEPMTFKVTEGGFERDGQRTLNQLANRNAQFDARRFGCDSRLVSEEIGLSVQYKV